MRSRPPALALTTPEGASPRTTAWRPAGGLPARTYPHLPMRRLRWVPARPDRMGDPFGPGLTDAYGTEISPKSTGDPFAFGAQGGYYTDQATPNDTGMVLCTWRY